MVERLLLGSGSVLSSVAARASGQVRVGTPDEHLASTLTDGVEVSVLDPTDERALAALNGDVVFVFERSERRALAIARAVESALPAASLLVCVGGNVTPDGELASLADQLVDPSRAVASRVLACVGDSRLPELWTVLRGIDRLAVVTHDNPDPDAIASGVALARLATRAGCEADVCYYGDISHEENRAFVNLLDLNLRQLDPGADLSPFDGVALVDHARPGINDGLPPDIPVDIIVDHHPPRGPLDARFLDVRVDVGATSTLLAEYLDDASRGIDGDVATALLFGIQVDTDGFKRGVSAADFRAAATLVPAADLSLIERIETPSIDRGTYDVLARAIDNRRVESGALLSFVGAVGNRDVLPQAADKLLELEGVSTTLVYGIVDGVVHLSARSRAEGLDLGESVREAFGQVGDAGGHVDMAGAQLELGLLGELEDIENVAPLVESFVADRFLEVYSQPRQRGPPGSALEGRYDETGETFETDSPESRE